MTELRGTVCSILKSTPGTSRYTLLQKWNSLSVAHLTVKPLPKIRTALNGSCAHAGFAALQEEVGTVTVHGEVVRVQTP